MLIDCIWKIPSSPSFQFCASKSKCLIFFSRTVCRSRAVFFFVTLPRRQMKFCCNALKTMFQESYGNIFLCIPKFSCRCSHYLVSNASCWWEEATQQSFVCNDSSSDGHLVAVQVLDVREEPWHFFLFYLPLQTKVVHTNCMANWQWIGYSWCCFLALSLQNIVKALLLGQARFPLLAWERQVMLR